MHIQSVPEAGSAAGRPSVRMLVVDDLPYMCTFFQELVRRLKGIHVDLVTEVNPRRAVEMLEKERFDVVVSDFRMPTVDGLTLLAAAHKANPRGTRLLMSGYDEIPATPSILKAAHVDGYLEKPIDPQDALILLFDILHGNAAALEEMRRRARDVERMVQN